MSGKRQNIQYSLALEPVNQGETPDSGHQGAEPSVAEPAPESSAVTEQLMEEVCNRENLVRAWKRVRQNKGGPETDGAGLGMRRRVTSSATPASPLTRSPFPQAR